MDKGVCFREQVNRVTTPRAAERKSVEFRYAGSSVAIRALI